MGLDMYGYYRKAGGDRSDNELFFEWRKHQILHDWMEDLWLTKKTQRSEEDRFLDGLDGDENDWNAIDFNCVGLPLTEEDLDSLECDIEDFYIDEPEELAVYKGDGGYYHDDKEFIDLARRYLKDGYEVYYDSWW